ncbi:hypothetical protein M1L60_00040 [Actinoplanes sp. TRM 88003]|uniref:Uncharacterized protein n=1 Tax=Paractinoplanes aksuensis TaxID=2939490 RepID=A0ABT1DDT5_9ACTN|nr:hypothetical protein [Actinoplanes aksuensis]MCO8268972.1 hypothetical protein [Actinoplanes aksuensis]
MKLSDLLETVREDAPAARYTVDDVVAAGRRRRRRRNTGWAIAALLAVFAAVGVPQLVARPSVPPATPPPPRAGSLDLLFSGYRSGDLRVGDPEWVSLTNQLASIGREVAPGEYQPVGRLALYPAGAVPYTMWLTLPREPAGSIHGHEASFLSVRNNAMVKSTSLLTWKNADGSMVLMASHENRLSRAEMVRLATAFRVTAPRPARLPFAISWVPPDMRLVAVDVSRPEAATALVTPARDGIGFELEPVFEQAAFVNAWSDPGLNSAPRPIGLSFPRSTPGNATAPSGGIVIGAQRGFVPGTEPKPDCTEFTQQFHVRQCVAAPDATSNVVARAGYDVPVTDLERVATAARLVSSAVDPATWPTAREAFPTSAWVER